MVSVVEREREIERSYPNRKRKSKEKEREREEKGRIREGGEKVSIPNCQCLERHYLFVIFMLEIGM